MKKKLLLSALLLVSVVTLSWAQEYLNQDQTLSSGNYVYLGFSNITITVPQGQIVSITFTGGYGGGNLIVAGQLTINKSDQDNMQIGGNLTVESGGAVSVNGNFTTSQNVTLNTNSSLSVTKNYASNLPYNSGESVQLLTGSQLLIGGNAAFNAGHCIINQDALLKAEGDLEFANAYNVITGALKVGGTLGFKNSPNELHCPGSIVTKNLLNEAERNPDALSGSGFIQVLGSFISNNPLTSDAAIVIDYDPNQGGADIGSATRGVMSPCATTLYVKLSQFTCSYKANSIQVSWQTATELNNKGFYIERSTDGIHFEALDFIVSKALSGNSSDPVDYNYSDKGYGISNYYRLKQVALDGSITYSTVIHQNVPNALNAAATATDQVVAYPNPAGSFIDFKVTAGAVLFLYDANGRLLRQIALNAGVNRISLSGISSGLYYYRYGAQKGRFIKK